MNSRVSRTRDTAPIPRIYWVLKQPVKLLKINLPHLPFGSYDAFRKDNLNIVQVVVVHVVDIASPVRVAPVPFVNYNNLDLEGAFDDLDPWRLLLAFPGDMDGTRPVRIHLDRPSSVRSFLNYFLSVVVTMMSCTWGVVNLWFRVVLSVRVPPSIKL